VAVIGDVMLDVYVHGRVDRISPEAPVPVVEVTGRSKVLGGASNVAANLASLGCHVYLFGVCGKDRAGMALKTLLSKAGIGDGLHVDLNLPTTSKTRVVAKETGQQLLRVDEEKVPHLDSLTNHLMIGFTKALESGHLGAVILSDYAKGVVTSALVAEVVRICSGLGVPVLVDPRRGMWDMYYGATVIKPNIFELRAAANDPNLDRTGDIIETARRLAVEYSIRGVLVTLGARGMILVLNGSHWKLPAMARKVFDVSGAGDTAMAVFAACICSGQSMREAARMANLAAGVVVGKQGISLITRKELADADQATVD